MSREDWDVFNEIKEERKEKRRQNLKKNTQSFGADPSWNIHTEYHWSKIVDIEGKSTRVDFWPSSNKWKVGDRYFRGGLPKALKEIIHDTRSTSTSARTENSEARTEDSGTRKE